MKNFDAIRQMPLKSFANMIFEVVKRDCKTKEEFERFLEKEIPENMEVTVKEALQNLQCSDSHAGGK